MLDDLRQRIEEFLGAGRHGVLSSSGTGGVVSLPVRYRAREMELDCLVPRWHDLAYWVEENPSITLVVLVENTGGFSWLHYQGRATTMAAPEWADLWPALPAGLHPEDFYLVLRLQPARIELMRGPQGWAMRETLDF